MVTKRSSKARIWNEARTRIAILLSGTPSRRSRSISSAASRASSSSSHTPRTSSFAPAPASVRSVLPSRPALFAMSFEAAPRICAVER